MHGYKDPQYLIHYPSNCFILLLHKILLISVINKLCQSVGIKYSVQYLSGITNAEAKENEIGRQF